MERPGLPLTSDGIRRGARPVLRDLPGLVRGLPAFLRRDHLLRNSLFLMLTIAGRALLGFVYWVIAARLIPTATIGLAAAFISAYTLASVIANPGLHSGLNQALPSARPGKEWSALVNGSIVTGAACSIVVGSLIGAGLPLVSPQFSPVAASPLSFIGFVAGVTGSVLGVIVDFTFVAQRASGVMFARSLVFGVGKIPLLLVSIHLVGRHSSTGVWSTWVVADLVSIAGAIAFGLPAMGRGYRFSLEGAGAKLRAMVRDLGGHHLTNLGGILPMLVLPIEVVARVSAQANAYFYVTWMLCSLFFMISPSVEFALFTEGSHDPTSIWATARRSLMITAGLLVVPMAGYALLGRFVLGIYGPAYARQGATLLLVLVSSALPDAVTNIYVSVLRVERRLLESSGLNLAMAVVALAGAWFLLPRLGITGAGVAWLAAQLAGTAWTAARVYRRAPVPVAASGS